MGYNPFEISDVLPQMITEAGDHGSLTAIGKLASQLPVDITLGMSQLCYRAYLQTLNYGVTRSTHSLWRQPWGWTRSSHFGSIFRPTEVIIPSSFSFDTHRSRRAA
jgi:hypothetical protein